MIFLDLTFILRAADFACEVGFPAGVGFEEITAVGAEDEGPNGCHGEGVRLRAAV